MKCYGKCSIPPSVVLSCGDGAVSEHSFHFLQIPREVLYGSHSPVHTLSSSSRGTLQSLQGSMSPPMARSMPSSPSRVAYGGGGSGGVRDPSTTLAQTLRLSGAGRSSAICSSSAILERRDVKPGEIPPVGMCFLADSY